MSFWQRQEQTQRLRAISLEVVMPPCGVQPYRHDKHKWHTPAGVLSVNGAKFMNWNCGRGGGGTIGLVIHLHHLDFKAAVDGPGRNYPEAIPLPAAAPTAQAALKLPAPNPGSLERVKNYLVGQRGIASAILDPLIQAITSMPTPEPTPFSCCWERKTSRSAPNSAEPPPAPGVACGVAWHPAPEKTSAFSPFRPPRCQPSFSGSPLSMR